MIGVCVVSQGSRENRISAVYKIWSDKTGDLIRGAASVEGDNIVLYTKSGLTREVTLLHCNHQQHVLPQFTTLHNLYIHFDNLNLQ